MSCTPSAQSPLARIAPASASGTPAYQHHSMPSDTPGRHAQAAVAVSVRACIAASRVCHSIGSCCPLSSFLTVIIGADACDWPLFAPYPSAFAQPCASAVSLCGHFPLPFQPFGRFQYGDWHDGQRTGRRGKRGYHLWPHLRHLCCFMSL